MLASSIVPIAIRSLQIKAGEKTALEMAMIQEASRNYYVDNNSWPRDIPTLQAQGYLNPGWKANNPWNNAYQISSTNLNLSVSTDVPIQWTNLVASHLPGAVINTTTVSSTVATGNSAGSLPVGTIIAWSSNALPSTGTFLWCDGRIYKASDYQSLFRVVGNIFGGDGVATFAVPDLRGRTIVGLNVLPDDGSNTRVTSSDGYDVNNIGGVFGEEKHRLTVAEMPPHHHEAGPSLGNIPNSFGTSGVMRWRVDSYGVGQSTDTGGNQPHSIIQPSMTLAYIIKAN